MKCLLSDHIVCYYYNILNNENYQAGQGRVFEIRNHILKKTRQPNQFNFCKGIEIQGEILRLNFIFSELVV